MGRKPVPVKLSSDKEQIASAREEGAGICRQLGHLPREHHNTKMNRVETRCNRCGRLLGFREA